MEKKAGNSSLFLLDLYFMESDKLFNIFKQSTGVATDSRNCYPGSLFFALKGDSFNGNDYALQALKDGCSYAVVDDKKLSGNAGCILVPNVLEALQSLASHYRSSLPTQVIGITGTNGKTTTKELMTSVLSEKFKIWSTRGNLNNHIGVPLTILSMPLETEVAIIEMGANHIGEIALLSSIAQPDYGIITNVGKAHLEGFGSFEGVKKAKGELYQFLRNNQSPAFINIDNAQLLEIWGNGAYVGYGTKEVGLVVGRNATASPFLEFEWKTANSELWYKVVTQLPGLYNFENALATVCVGVYFKISPQLINKALAGYEPVNNRSQLTKTANNKVLMDAYNANPSSMNAALENFRSINEENKVLILGGMKELGNDSLFEHKVLVAKVMEMNVKQCVFVGSEFRDIIPDDSRVIWFESSETLKNYLKDNPLKNSVVLVKGSRSNRLETIFEAL